MASDEKQPKARLSKKDWTLLVIDAAKPSSLTPIQLQKSLFLIGQKMPNVVSRGFYKFIPYNFGPFCREIYSDAVSLRDAGLVEQISRPGQDWPEYVISPTGTKAAEDLRQRIPQEARDYLETLVKWVEKQSFPDLLHAVYRAYPDYAKNSVFNTES